MSVPHGQSTSTDLEHGEVGARGLVTLGRVELLIVLGQHVIHRNVGETGGLQRQSSYPASQQREDSRLHIMA